MFGLKDKVIVVTGGNRGIGESVVRKLENLGANVAYINKSKPGNSKSLHIFADVTSSQQMEKAFTEIEMQLGPVYGIVCNAGITRDNFFHKSSEDEWNDVINVNLTGAVNTVRPAISKLYAQKEGSIVFVSSIVGENGNLGQSNYAASKAGLIGFAKSLAKEAAKNNVRSNLVAPGFTNTSMTEDLPEKVVDKITSNIPLGRFATPEEIAWSIIFLLSPTMSSFITGEVIRVNGGHLM